MRLRLKRWAYPGSTRAVLVLAELEVGHELLDLDVLLSVVVPATLGFAAAQSGHVGVGHIVANSVTNGVNPLDFAAKHLGELVHLQSSCEYVT